MVPTDTLDRGGYMGGRCAAFTWSSEVDGRPDWPSDHMPTPWPDVRFECSSSLSTHFSKNQERTDKPPSRVRGARPHPTADVSLSPRSRSIAAARATSRQRGGCWILVGSLLRAAELWEKESKTASRFRDVGMTHGRPAGKPSETKRGSGGWAQEEGPRRRWGAPAGGGGDGALLGAVWLPRPVTREGYFTTR